MEWKMAHSLLMILLMQEWEFATGRKQGSPSGKHSSEKDVRAWDQICDTGL